MAFKPTTIKHVLSAALIGAFAVSATPALAADNANATVSVRVMKPLSITSSGTLNFGKFAPKASTGSITISADGATVTTSAASDLFHTGTTAVPTFTVTGEASTNFSIALTATPPAGTTLTPSHSITGTPNTGASGDTTGVTFTVGGTLAYTSAPSEGNLSGSVTATVSYP